jgi:predicted GIY-YIG superfamily endonuclease
MIIVEKKMKVALILAFFIASIFQIEITYTSSLVVKSHSLPVSLSNLLSRLYPKHCENYNCNISNSNSSNRNNYTVYVLTNTKNNCTYVGITNNLIRRIRQHNGELVGGAKYTTAKKGIGLWEYFGFILHLDKRLALSIEKTIQIRTKKARGSSPIQKRLNSIISILEEYPNVNFTRRQIN